MAAIAIADCTVTVLGVTGAFKTVKIVTPATADDGDTIDCSSLFTNHTYGWAYGATDTCLALVHAPTSTTIKLPGSTDNEARTCIVCGD